MTTHPIVGVKRKLVTLIKARLSGVDVLYGTTSGGARRDRVVSLGDSSASYDQAYFGGGVESYDQSWSVEVQCISGTFHRFPSEAESSALEMVDAIFAVVANDSTLGGTAIDAHVVDVSVEVVSEPTPYTAEATVNLAIIVRQH